MLTFTPPAMLTLYGEGLNLTPLLDFPTGDNPNPEKGLPPKEGEDE